MDLTGLVVATDVENTTGFKITTSGGDEPSSANRGKTIGLFTGLTERKTIYVCSTRI